ncbi:MAG TPA: hypothetical protein VI968_04500 [archaeon]|nr:hypothetical protein [archaeon]
MAENYELTTWDFVPFIGFEQYEKRKHRDLEFHRGLPGYKPGDMQKFDRVARAYEKRDEWLSAYNLVLACAAGITIYAAAKFLLDLTQ